MNLINNLQGPHCLDYIQCISPRNDKKYYLEQVQNFEVQPDKYAYKFNKIYSKAKSYLGAHLRRKS
jgi:hypothetical protein